MESREQRGITSGGDSLGPEQQRLAWIEILTVIAFRRPVEGTERTVLPPEHVNGPCESVAD